MCVLLRGRAGDRALHVTASVGCSETLRALLDAGVDVNALNSARQSALYLALKSDKPQVDTVRHDVILTQIHSACTSVHLFRWTQGGPRGDGARATEEVKR